MKIEKMNELIEKWKAQKQAYNEQMDKKISNLERERDLAVAAATQKIFARHHLSADELLKLKHASKQTHSIIRKHVKSNNSNQVRENMTTVQLKPNERIDQLSAQGVQIIQSSEVFAFSLDATSLAGSPARLEVSVAGIGCPVTFLAVSITSRTE